MKPVRSLTEEIVNNLPYITSYECTKILVMVDRIYTKPWTNHKLELNYYSVRYNAKEKTIFIYSKCYEADDSFDFDCDDRMEFPVDFNLKINTHSKHEMIIEKLKNIIGRWFKLCINMIMLN